MEIGSTCSKDLSERFKAIMALLSKHFLGQILYHTITTFKYPFENIVENGKWRKCWFFYHNNSLANNKIFDLFNLKAFVEQNKCESKSRICFGKGLKKMWEKEKMLVTIIFFISYNVFKRVISCDHFKF